MVRSPVKLVAFSLVICLTGLGIANAQLSLSQAPGTSTEAFEPVTVKCNEPIQLPPGTLVRRSIDGDSVLLSLPFGFGPKVRDGKIEFVLQPMSLLAESEDIEVDCDCDEGLGGGCTEVISIDGTVRCEEEELCFDCKATISKPTEN